MNEDHGFTKKNLLASLPVSLREDPKMVALAEAVSAALVRSREEIDRVSIYPSIDQLDEALLDILAHDFKVDWWDGDYSPEEKRRTLKSSWQVHKILGTKAAVEIAIRAVYPAAQVKEWFEYGGEPYHFKLNINIANDGADTQKQRRVLNRLEYCKNLRSHLDGITYSAQGAPARAHAGGAFLGSRQKVECRFPTPGVARPRGEIPAHIGVGIVSVHQRTRVKIFVDKEAAYGALAGLRGNERGHWDAQ